LQTGFEDFALDLKAGDMAGCGGIADGFAGADDRHGQEGEHERTIDLEFERVNPDEGGNGGLQDLCIIQCRDELT
jgi:hypothetical protein